jgi:hypothetical protein
MHQKKQGSHSLMKHLHQRNNKEVVYKNLSKPTQNNAKVKPLSIISREIKPMLLHMLENLLKIDTTKAKKKSTKGEEMQLTFFPRSRPLSSPSIVLHHLTKFQKCTL